MKNYLEQLTGCNCLGAIPWRVIIWGVIMRLSRKQLPGGSFSGGNYQGSTLVG